jgi:hypothetical protein
VTDIATVLIALLLFRLALQPRSGWKIYLMQFGRTRLLAPGEKTTHTG